MARKTKADEEQAPVPDTLQLAKKIEAEVGEADTPPKVAQIPSVKKALTHATCGAVDMHSLGPDGKPDHPACDMKLGHSGDHHALHAMRVESGRVYDQVYGKLIHIDYEIVDGPVWFNDAALVPAPEIKLGKMPARDGGAQDALRKTVQELMQT